MIDSKNDFFWISNCTTYGIVEMQDSTFEVFHRQKVLITTKKGFSNFNEAHTYTILQLGLKGRLIHRIISDFPLFFDKNIRKKILEENEFKEYHINVFCFNKPLEETRIIQARSKQAALIQIIVELNDYDKENLKKLEVIYEGLAT